MSLAVVQLHQQIDSALTKTSVFGINKIKPYQEACNHFSINSILLLSIQFRQLFDTIYI